MRKIKVIIGFLSVLLVIGYLVYDSFIYSYGMGIGVFKEKMPHRLSLEFTNSYSIDNEFVVMKYSTVDFFVVQKGLPITLVDNSEILIDKILSYSFDEDHVILKVMDNKGAVIGLNLKELPNKSLEISKVDTISQFKNYVNLDQDYNYFKRLKAIRNIWRLFIFISFGYLFYMYLRIFFKRKR